MLNGSGINLLNLKQVAIANKLTKIHEFDKINAQSLMRRTHAKVIDSRYLTQIIMNIKDKLLNISFRIGIQGYSVFLEWSVVSIIL